MKTILIVDDFESSRSILSRTLQTAGYSVLQKESGAHALDCLKENTIDLVITDLNMPDMDGIVLTKNIRVMENYQYVPVILLTANSKSETKQQMAKEAGATAWLEKPFKVEALLESVKKLIR